ncbi:MAG: carboxypeptidase regulatory-like domain-containing protein, partial [Fidelibacterota bacterium]
MRTGYLNNKRFLQTVTLFLLAVSLLWAGTDGTIRGQVKDMDGNGLPGAQVFIKALGLGAVADLEGNYIILNIPVGTYDVTVMMIGYQTQVRKDVEVIMDKTIWLNFNLPVAAIEGESVEVKGQREMVEKGSTAKKITVDREAVEALPIRDITELYSLQSGVVKVESRNQGIPDHEERGLEEVHVRGGRSGEIAYMIDGLYIRNPIFGGIGNGTRLNLFAVKEFDWQPGGFNAEYGDAMSAVSNMHTNMGGDEFQYKFKYETSLVGAAMGSQYDDLRG